MHTAPRRLMSSQVVGPPIQPDVSVLPGCGLAIPSVRIYLRRDVQGLVDLLKEVEWHDPADPEGVNAQAEVSVHVDDVAQQASGPLEQIVVPVVMAAEGFVGITDRLRLRVSTKSIISIPPNTSPSLL